MKNRSPFGVAVTEAWNSKRVGGEVTMPGNCMAGIKRGHHNMKVNTYLYDLRMRNTYEGTYLYVHILDFRQNKSRISGSTYFRQYIRYVIGNNLIYLVHYSRLFVIS